MSHVHFHKLECAYCQCPALIPGVTVPSKRSTTYLKEITGRGRHGRGAVIFTDSGIMPSVQRPRTLNQKNSEDVVDWLRQATQSSTASAKNLDAPSSSSSALVTCSQVTTHPPAADRNGTS